jgi:DNA-binding transcriptional LysR family regulator
MDLRRLRYFVTVAEELHFGRAAKRLHMAQQPLSAQVRELEREIGYDLFERYANRIRLTPAGSVLLDDARALLAGSTRAVERARRAAQGEIGTVRVGYCAAAIECTLPAAIRTLGNQHPAIGFDLREMTQIEQLAAMERDEIDVGFAYLPVDESAFASLPLFEEELLVAVPAGHALACHATVPLASVAREPLVAFSRERHAKVVAIIENALRADSVEMAISLSANDSSSLLALVAQGFGVGFIPEHALIPRSDVAYLRLERPIRMTFAAIWSKLVENRAVRKNFIDVLAGATLGVADHVLGGAGPLVAAPSRPAPNALGSASAAPGPRALTAVIRSLPA